jgi:hypothetical protein
MSFVVSILHRLIFLCGGLIVATIVVTSSVSASTISIALVSNEGTESSPPPTPSIEQQLQIDQLQQETSWEGRLQGYLPAGSALVALAAAGWGVFVYLRDQRRGFYLRTQMEIANNLNRLIEHKKDEAIKSAQIISALTALNALASQSPDEAKLLREVTSIITAAVMDDINFNDVNQVRFEALCLANWAPYETHLRDNPDQRGYILYRYLSALLELQHNHSAYISRVNWDAKAMKFSHPMDIIMEPENDFRLFQRLVQGVLTHWQLIDEDSRRADLAKEFQAATGNHQITLQLLGGSQP